LTAIPTARPIPWDIYEEHLDEAAFVWGAWEQSLDAANYTLDEVIAGPEERLLAHLDGLVLGGEPVAQKLLLPALADDDPGKVAAAAWALLQAEDADHLDVVLEAVATAEKRETRAAIGRAFELCHRTDRVRRLLPRLGASPPNVQAVIVAAVVAEVGAAPAAERGAGRGAVPGGELPLATLLESRHPELLAAALRALRRAPDPELAPAVEAALGSPYVTVRDAAIEAGVVLGLKAAWRACNKLVARNAPGCKLALAVLALSGEAVDRATVMKRLEVEALRRDAAWALGFTGTLEAVAAALALAGDETIGAVAGDSFATITGATLAGDLVLVGQTDNTSPPAPDDDDEDAPLPVLRPEDDLPRPDPDHLRAWWAKAQSKADPPFDPEQRYVGGRLLAGELVRAAIQTGPTWRRRIWCLELARRTGQDLDGDTWARHQRARLAAFAIDPRRPWGAPPPQRG